MLTCDIGGVIEFLNVYEKIYYKNNKLIISYKITLLLEQHYPFYLKQ